MNSFKHFNLLIINNDLFYQLNLVLLFIHPLKLIEFYVIQSLQIAEFFLYVNKPLMHHYQIKIFQNLTLMMLFN